MNYSEGLFEFSDNEDPEHFPTLEKGPREKIPVNSPALASLFPQSTRGDKIYQSDYLHNWEDRKDTTIRDTPVLEKQKLKKRQMKQKEKSETE